MRLQERLSQRVAEWRRLSSSQRQQRLDDPATRGDAEHTVLNELAHSAATFSQGDAASAELALTRATQVAESSTRLDLKGLVASMSQQLAGAKDQHGSRSPELVEALRLIQDGQPEPSLPLFERAVASARQKGTPDVMAECLFCLGQAQFVLQRHDEARASLQAALQLATQAQNNQLLTAIQQALTVIAASAK